MVYKIGVKTHSRSELVDIGVLVAGKIEEIGARNGICYIFVPHTTCAITINENADPSVKEDILAGLEKIVPWTDRNYRHSEGNSAAHIKASMLGFSLNVFVENGALALGRWQGIFLAEFDGPRRREVWLQVVET